MALHRALRQQGSESLASNHPRAERPERKNGIDIRPQDLVQFTATKAKAGVTGRRRSLRWWRGEILAIYFYGVE